MKTPWFPVKPSDTHKNPFSWKSELTWTKKKKENFVSLKSLIHQLDQPDLDQEIKRKLYQPKIRR